MGIKTLWKAIKDADLVHTLEGKACFNDIVREVHGKAVAVDLSIWMFQAATQRQVEGVFSRNAHILKLLFDRVSNWLRLGVTPVGVADGAMPFEKRAVLLARGNIAELPEMPAEWIEDIVEVPQGAVHITEQCYHLLQAMGLPVVLAPGEAEATAAALNAAGHVDAVATPDGDALVFGARTVYPTAKLLAGSPAESRLEVCKAADVGARLLDSYDPETTASALLAVGLLCGGDYDNQHGASGVTSAAAFPAVCKLMAQDGSECISPVELLRAELRAPAGASPPASCRGCRRCGHDSGQPHRIEEHNAARRCPDCPLGVGGLCTDRRRPRLQCSCGHCSDPHASALHQVVRKARSTKGFMQQSRIARNAYASQMAKAAGAVVKLQRRLQLLPGERMSWLRPPDDEAIYKVLVAGGMGGSAWNQWTLEEVRAKCVALHMAWQQRQDGGCLQTGRPPSP